MRPRTSAPFGITSMPPSETGSSSIAMNCSPILLRSLFTLSIMRMPIFDPVGIVQPVLAAFEDVGCVTRSVFGSNRGSEELEVLAGVVVRVELDVDEFDRDDD